MIIQRLKFLITLVLVSCVFCFGNKASDNFQRSAEHHDKNFEIAAKSLLPEGLSLSPASHSACLFEGLNGGGKVVWHAFFSHLLSPIPSGYVGPINLIIGIDDRQQVTGVKILSHSETPSFVEGIESSWFLDQFKGKTTNDAVQAGSDLDGITHATVTVNAICESIRACLAISSTNGAASNAKESIISRSQDLPAVPIACLLMTFVLFILNEKIPKPISSALIAFFLGFATNQFLSLAHLRIFATSSTSIRVLPLPVIILIILSILAILLRPRGYCRGICPMGQFQDLISSTVSYISGAGNDFHFEAQTLDITAPTPLSNSEMNSTDKLSVVLRRGLGRSLLWVFLIILFFAPQFPGEKLEIFSALFVGNQGAFGLLFCLGTIIGAFLTPRFYCRVLCPLNSLFEDVEEIIKTIRRGPKR